MAYDTLDTSDVDDGDDLSIPPPSPVAAPVPAPVAAPVAPPVAPLNPTVAAYLKNKQNDLAEAQRQANQNRAVATIARAAGGLAYGSGQMGAAKSAGYDALDQAADAPVKDALTKQKYDATEAENAAELESGDPTSAKSRAAQKMAKKLYPDLDEKDLANVPASDIEELIYKPQELHEKVLQRRAESEGKRLDAAAKAGERADAREKKATDAQDKLRDSTQQLLESARGNPAVAQAERDIYAAQKAKSLINSMGGDPDKLNNNQVKLLVSEIGKIAQGGVPSMSELEGLTPNTLVGKLAGVWQQLSNEPTPAHAGAFLKQYLGYANEVTKDAQKVVEDKYGRVLEPRKASLGPHYDTLRAQYLDRFKAAAPAAGAPQKPKPQAGSVVQVKGKQYRVGADGDSLEAM